MKFETDMSVCPEVFATPIGMIRKPVRIVVEELPAAPVYDYRPCSREEAEANPESSQYRYRNDDRGEWSKWYGMPRPFTWYSYDYQFQTRARPANEPKVEAPGDIISWQRAKERVDAGLAVETLRFENGPGRDWLPLTDDAIAVESGKAFQPKDATDWTYRIPLLEPAAQPEPMVEMNAEQATEWLRGDRDRRVIDVDGNTWIVAHTGDSLQMCIENSRRVALPVGCAPYRPLLPVTQSQVALLADVERLKSLVPELQAKYDDACVRGTRELRDMTGSRDAAIAALDQERRKSDRLRSALEAARRTLLAVPDTGNAITLVTKVLNETAGKGQSEYMLIKKPAFDHSQPEGLGVLDNQNRGTEEQ